MIFYFCQFLSKLSLREVYFKNFLETLINKVDKDTFFLLDNARIHHAKIVKAYAGSVKCHLLFNAHCCPEFNPIEHVFSKFKYYIRSKNDNENINHFFENIKNAFENITSKDLTNFYKKSLSFMS